MTARAMLLEHAADAGDPAALALAGVLGPALDQTGGHVAPVRGLDARAVRAALGRWFPGAAVLDAPRPQPAPSAADAQAQELDDLVALLIEHAAPEAGTPAEIACIARLVAGACLGRQHLWQDLGLPSRRELSALLERWFTPLARKNTHDMKWKKFFYKQLCLREGLFVCKAPTCGECADYALCFGPEV